MEVVATLSSADCTCLQPITRTVLPHARPRGSAAPVKEAAFSDKVELDRASFASFASALRSAQPLAAPRSRRFATLISSGAQSTIKQLTVPALARCCAVWIPFGAVVCAPSTSTSMAASTAVAASTAATYGGMFFTTASTAPAEKAAAAQRLHPNQVHLVQTYDGAIHGNLLGGEFSSAEVGGQLPSSAAGGMGSPGGPRGTGGRMEICGLFCHCDYLFVLTRTQILVYAVKLAPRAASALQQQSIGAGKPQAVTPEPPKLRLHGAIQLPCPLSCDQTAALGESASVLSLHIAVGTAVEANSMTRVPGKPTASQYSFPVLVSITESSAAVSKTVAQASVTRISATLATVRHAQVHVQGTVRDIAVEFTESHRCFAPVILHASRSNPQAPPRVATAPGPHLAVVECVDWLMRRIILRSANNGQAVMVPFDALFPQVRGDGTMCELSQQPCKVLETLDEVDVASFSSLGVLWSVKAMPDPSKRGSGVSVPMTLRVRDHEHDRSETVVAGEDSAVASPASMTLPTPLAVFFTDATGAVNRGTGGRAVFISCDAGSEWMRLLEIASAGTGTANPATSAAQPTIRRGVCAATVDDYVFVLVGNKVFARRIAASETEAAQLSSKRIMHASSVIENAADQASPEKPRERDNTAPHAVAERGSLHEWMLQRHQLPQVPPTAAPVSVDGEAAALVKLLVPGPLRGTASITSIPLRRLQECHAVRTWALNPDAPLTDSPLTLPRRGSHSDEEVNEESVGRFDLGGTRTVLRDSTYLVTVGANARSGKCDAVAHLVLSSVLEELEQLNASSGASSARLGSTAKAGGSGSTKVSGNSAAKTLAVVQQRRETLRSALVKYILRAEALEVKTLLLIAIHSVPHVTTAESERMGTASLLLAVAVAASTRGTFQRERWAPALLEVVGTTSETAIQAHLRFNVIPVLCTAINVGLSCGALGAMDVLSAMLDSVVTYTCVGTAPQNGCEDDGRDAVDALLVATLGRLAGFAQWGVETAACCSGTISAHVGPVQTGRKEAYIRPRVASTIPTTRNVEIVREIVSLEPRKERSERSGRHNERPKSAKPAVRADGPHAA